MNPVAKKLLDDLRRRVTGEFDPPEIAALLERCIDYVQSTADPENQPSQYGTTLGTITPATISTAIRAELADYYSVPDITGPAPLEIAVGHIIGGVLMRVFPK